MLSVSVVVVGRGIGDEVVCVSMSVNGLWCNGYRSRKWTQRHEFKSWTRMISFHIALIPFGKV